MGSRSPLQQQRRVFIRLIGGSIILASAGLLAGRHFIVEDDELQRAKEEKLGANSDPRLALIEKASLAPSSHNLQPWLIDLRGPADIILLRVDPERLLPVADPHARETLISLGCFLELLSMAAQAGGFRCEIIEFPEGNAPQITPVAPVIAQIRITPATTTEPLLPEPLLAMLEQRRTNRLPYDTQRTIPDDILASLLDAGSVHGIQADGTVNPALLQKLNPLAENAWQTEMSNSETVLESLKLTRVGKKEIEYHRDGIAVSGFLPEMAATFGLFPRDRVPEPDSTFMRSMITTGKEQGQTAAGWIWLYSQGNSHAQQIAAGRAYVRLQLAAAQSHIAMQPMSFLLSEAPAMQPHQKDLYDNTELNSDQHRLQMLVRIGYADPVAASPRRRLSDFILE
ncbi:Acg family FMN-binding oxidoreductase [Serratia aquatilis]|uniref:Acg family FMN-binding oxidoreductase n=1 Tax=Serratia aquatilis TaxID=1737515 RepID=A0ABV6EDG3_9GAMM